MDSIQQFKDGDMVYCYYGGAVYKGQISSDEKYPDDMRVDILFIADNGKEYPPLLLSPDFLYMPKDKLYLSADEAAKEGQKEKARKIAEKIQGYCDTIVTLEDLINFPLTHCLNENSKGFDEEAKTAYLRRSQELLKNK